MIGFLVDVLVDVIVEPLIDIVYAVFMWVVLVIWFPFALIREMFRR